MISVESKEGWDNRGVRSRLEFGQSQMASLLDDLAELSVVTQLLDVHERLRERMEASERENERLRGVTYENEQLRNRLETSEGQVEHLRQAMGQLRAENERHRKEREEAGERLYHLVNEIAHRLRPAGALRA